MVGYEGFGRVLERAYEAFERAKNTAKSNLGKTILIAALAGAVLRGPVEAGINYVGGQIERFARGDGEKTAYIVPKMACTTEELGMGFIVYDGPVTNLQQAAEVLDECMEIAEEEGFDPSRTSAVVKGISYGDDGKPLGEITYVTGDK